MGCCFSTGKVTAPPPVTAAAVQIPPPIEEESVKEVVVQTVSVSVPVPVTVPDIVPSAPAEVISDSEPELPHPLSPPPAPEISQSKSDICSVSVSHSYSTATTATAASILEDDALSKPHRPLPPPSSSTSRRNRPDRVLRSPGDRHSPQGGKQLRPRLVRERQSRQPNPTHNRRNADSGPLPRSGLSDNHPRRRSQSPATRAPSAARRSPMKKRVGAHEKDGATTEVKKEEEVEVKKEEDGEAVKDPEVSMECFIFL
ncbi:PREDICTED: proline-rich receptor-like protein kinase PERK2 [Camelina sativa]|uniref:Proline-rich receptor-like protein kinase PERK2 n=1 Tax=Camelina sativa TaxID=90675 RepID=A0ABM0UY42_CAMSA|nr:PREDICTED: proline-rich receptor-like protein kinase PERK2 [Camelina sativa]